MLSQELLRALIIFLGFGGLSVSTYLHYKKKKASNTMACPMNGSCEDVITSKYSKFLGIDVEVLGIFYYTSIIVAYSLFLFTPQVAPAWFTFGVLMSSVVAVLFSAYLTFCQAFNLRKWCTWCLTSAAFTGGILIAAVPSASIGLSALMAQYMGVMVWLAVVGSAIGLGISIAFDALYLTYLKDFEISDIQAESLNTLNHLAWASIGSVVIGMVGMALGDASLLNNPSFIAAGFILGIIILNDSAYSLYLANKMSELTFADIDENDYTIEKQYSFLLASISTASWTILLTLHILEPEFPLYDILAVYMAVIGALGLGGLYMSSIIEKRAEGTLPSWMPFH